MNSKKVFIFADKTQNPYEMDKETYNKLLVENITKTYKKADKNRYNEINEESHIIAKHLCLEDHNENFINKPQCRLINSAKSALGKSASQL